MWRIVAQAAGVVWTLPNSVVGLCAGLLGLCAGSRMQVRGGDLALVFHRWPWGPGGAVTLGNIILHTGDDLDSTCVTYEHRAGHCQHPHIRLSDHERAHVYQYMLLGLLFLPVYFAWGGVSVRNPLERAADRYALTGQGWWPWRPRLPSLRTME